MPRRRRLHVPGALHHAILRGNHRQAIFEHDDDYFCFEAILAPALERYGATVFAYCWMTNHVHLAIRIADAQLGSIMNILASRYARAKQRRMETTGHLFERRYLSRIVDADRYLLALVRYIHLNPVRARMVVEPRDYRWSSHRAYVGAPCPAWLDVDAVLRMFGATAPDALTAYQRFMKESPAEGERDAISTIALRGRGPRQSRSIAPISETVRRRGLDDIAAEVVIQSRLSMADVLSRSRHPALVEARTEIARRALREGAANLSQVAGYLRRAPSTLSERLQCQQPQRVPKP